jgi:hypothetical protein
VVGAGGVVGTRPVATITPGNVTEPPTCGTIWYTSVQVMLRIVGTPIVTT